ncbi:exonuclease of the beta-lactamase fold [Lactobacillus selangorensis]|uniref:Exonuclease of the beta-lactamase fold n=1 Tax=Lactobacillus selangorensis TaxID=81857 RepID=A0A0R2FYT7_9LACO|nr:MBL fold metallo-hydrolase [Lactobacillus selangorensis]KRN28875.1 exonuclease of the beta-lactamase fold [Lactobacillus selangorensis]KRN32715.1 exonuclease of the beta-lactamase fold [Lactobacillus selangorensis]
MTNVQFLHGLKTIGGNIMAVTTATSRVICDFGLTGPAIAPDQIDQAIASHDLPALPEIFHGEADAFAHEAIFISHLHLDHTGALPLIKSDIPVYVSQKTYDLYQVLLANGMAQPFSVQLHVLPFNQPLAIGDLSVTGLPSDHDVVGAMALLISDGLHTFGYSGDVRWHGPHPERVAKWVQVFKQRQLDLLMLEGTSFSFPDEADDQPHPARTEHEIAATLKAIAAANQTDLIAITLYARNVDRMIRFDQILRDANRTMVWEIPYARVIHTFAPDLPLTVLRETDDHQPLPNHWQVVGLAALQAAPERFVLQNDFRHLEWLALFNQVTYLHSNGEPLGDYNPRYKQLQDFLTTHHFHFERLAASGHAKQEDLVKIAQMVAAQCTIPWHSFHPELEAQAIEAAHAKTHVYLPQLNEKLLF